MKWIFQRFFSPLNLSRACRRSVRHTPFLVCGMLRFGCATCSDFTVRHAPIYAIFEQQTQFYRNKSLRIFKVDVSGIYQHLRRMQLVFRTWLARMPDHKGFEFQSCDMMNLNASVPWWG